MTDHIAAIHVLKSKLQLTDDDYRALLQNIAGKQSTRAMTQAERGRVRDHMQRLAEKLGVARPQLRGAPRFRDSAEYREASPMERKVHAMWNALARNGVIRNGSKEALRAWVKRQTGMDDLKFCNWVQFSSLIESLKEWALRAQDGAARKPETAARPETEKPGPAAAVCHFVPTGVARADRPGAAISAGPEPEKRA